MVLYVATDVGAISPWSPWLNANLGSGKHAPSGSGPLRVQCESMAMKTGREIPREALQFDGLPVEVKGLNKRYKGGVWANRDISMTAEPVEVLAILGPNGAGKTTLVRQITTEIQPTSGEVRVFGHDVVADPLRVKDHLGTMPQEADPFEYLTTHQHLRIFGKLRGLSAVAARRRADELVEELRLVEHRDVLAGKLSGGLRRRLLVGIAALARPPLLVLDEPTTGLDPQSRRALWALLRGHTEKGATVLLTTHYMEEAEALSDRVGIIDNGRLLALDTIANLRAKHGYEFKVTFFRNVFDSEEETIYGADDRALVEKVRVMGIQQFSVSRTNLEDVYLALTDGKEPLDGEAG